MKKVLQRFVDVWKPDFLHKITTSKEKTLSTTIWFWVINSAIIPLIITIIFIVFGFIFKVGLPDLLRDFSNETGITDEAGIIMTDGILSTQDIDEPIFDDENGFLFVLDTQTSKYDNADLFKEYDEGLIILKDKAYTKDEGDLGFNTVIYKNEKIIPNFSLNFGKLKGYINNYFLLLIFIGSLFAFIFTFLFLQFLDC